MKYLKNNKTDLLSHKKIIIAKCGLSSIISFDEMEDLLESSSEGKELLNKNKYERVITNAGIEYANMGMYAFSVENDGTPHYYIAECYEYKCIDENDSNFNRLKTAVAYKEIDENKNPIWLFPKFFIFDGDSDSLTENTLFTEITIYDNENFETVKEHVRAISKLCENSYGLNGGQK